MNQSINEVPFLLAQNGPLQGQIWPINQPILIGRDPQCDIVINDRQVSRKHARVENQDSNGNTLSDLSSKNGTLLNGEFVNGPTLLKDGDEIIVGLVQEFLFVSSDATLPLGQIVPEEQSAAQKLFIDKKARRIWIGEKELIPALSVSQYELLLYLYDRSGYVVSREEIVNAVWGEEESIGVTEQALDALVRRLRGRINKIDPTHDYILTIRGVGFKFENYSFS